MKSAHPKVESPTSFLCTKTCEPRLHGSARAELTECSGRILPATKNERTSKELTKSNNLLSTNWNHAIDFAKFKRTKRKAIKMEKGTTSQKVTLTCQKCNKACEKLTQETLWQSKTALSKKKLDHIVHQTLKLCHGCLIDARKLGKIPSSKLWQLKNNRKLGENAFLQEHILYTQSLGQ